MRNFLPLLLLGAVLAPAAAHSQASVDPRALKALQTTPADAGKPAAAPPPATPAKPPARATRPEQTHPARGHAAQESHSQNSHKPEGGKPEGTRPHAGKPAAKPAAAPDVRLSPTPPAPPELPPAIPVPVRSPLPPAPAPVAADAPGEATPLHAGPLGSALRLTFGAGRSDFNPATESALRGLAHAAPPGSRFDVVAHAAGVPEDPSSPRRTSLSRALAVRSVLIAEGIASERILVRALGAEGDAPGTSEPSPGAPDDRADITVLPSASAPPTETPAAPK